MNEAEFLAERKSGIGGSDIASVLNMGYGCALRLYRQKRGEEPDFPPKNQDAMELGQWLEPLIARKFAQRHGAEVQEVTVKRHPDHPELLVHLDRLMRYRSDLPWRALEIKALGTRVFLEMKRSGLSVDYSLQLQWEMMIWDLHLGTFAVMNRDTGEMLDWDHDRDDELCQILKIRALQFWRDVQEGNAPRRLDPDDPRCGRCEYRRSCQGSALIHIDGKQELEQDESLRPLLVEYRERKELFDQAEGLLDETKAQIQDAMGKRGSVAVGESKIYYKPQKGRRYWDSDSMGSDIGRLAGVVDYDGRFVPLAPAAIEAAYRKEGTPSRPLRIYL